MKITKLYTKDDNKSYFEDIIVNTCIKHKLGFYSDAELVTDLKFRESNPGEYFDWHTAPQAQYIIYLDGKVEVEASGGETRIFTKGDILLACDLTGTGHITRVLSKSKAVIVTLLPLSPMI